MEKLANHPFKADTAEANGTSIAFLAEYDGRRVLLSGDAYSPVLLECLQRLETGWEEGRIQLDAFKLPHHGSKSNLHKDLLEKLNCIRYLFSTDGTQTKHPDREAVARVIKFGGHQAELIFNYRTKFNEVWDDRRLMDKYGYSATYPAVGAEGYVLEL